MHRRGRLRCPRLCALAALALPLLQVAAGCATYSDRTAAARAAVGLGDYAGALKEYDSFLGLDESGALPEKWSSDAALGVLERATVLQAQESFAASATSFQAADKELDLLDLSGDFADILGKYFFSGSASKYRSSPTEKLSLNAINTLNYLALGDLAGARVEAKRFTVMRNYLKDHRPEDVHGVFGSYLAGFVFERLGEVDSALRYYDEALEERSFASLTEPVRALAARSLYRGRNLSAYIGGLPSPSAAPSDGTAEVLTVVSLGTVPFKVPKRIPIGEAVGLYSLYATGNTDVLEHSALKVLSYPELSGSGNAVFEGASLWIDGEPVELELATDLSGDIRREYEDMKPKIIGAALSRMIVRAVAAEAARVAAKEAARDVDTAPLISTFAAVVVEGAMVAMDRPDTRSWTLLPGRVLVSRTRVAPGPHRIDVSLRSAEGDELRRFDIDPPPGGFAVVVVTTLR